MKSKIQFIRKAGIPFFVSPITLFLLAAWPASAGTAYWFGTNGVSATTNWSDAANWSGAAPGGYSAYTPVNNAANFNWNTVAGSPSSVTVHVDGDYGTPGSGTANAWSMVFGQTNGYQTVLIDPGMELHIEAGGPGNGLFVAPQGWGNGGGSSTVNSGPYTNYTTIEGGGTFYVNGQLRIEGGSSAVNNHYSILDMSGLNTFIQTNSAGSASRFLLLNGSTRSQALIYLATNNFYNGYGDVQIGWIGGTYSNSLPVGLYLGFTNSIITGAGSGGNGNQLVVGIDGVTNAFMKFNPKFLGDPNNKPAAYLSGNGSGSSGMMNWVAIGQATGARVPANAVVDFTGGTVTWNINDLRLGRSGDTTFPRQANGTLTFDDGTITVRGGDIGEQTTSSGSAAAGILNIGTNAVFTVSNTLYVPFIAGTPNASSSGAININGGTLNAGSVLDANNKGVLNVTNSNLGLALAAAPGTVTNIVIGTLGVGGTTNVINITAIPVTLGGSATPANPIRFHLITYTTLNGTLNCGLGSLPASYNLSYPYKGYLDAATTPNTIDFVLTNAPPEARALTWSGTNSVGSPVGNWDVGTTLDWLKAGVLTAYSQYDQVSFYDVAAPAQTNIVLTTTLTPGSLTVSNSPATIYTLGGNGKISGVTGLLKQGNGTLVLDENGSGAGYNDFGGGVLISGGTLQVGNGDNAGTLSAGGVTNNATLAFNAGAYSTVSNGISGNGTVVQAGGNALALAGANTFTGPVLVTNNSTLQIGNASALGTTAGGTVIANGSTLDLNAFNIAPLAGEPVTVQGAGVGGVGAIINNNAAAGGYLTNVTLSGDTTLGGSARSDLSGFLSTGGQAYNVTVLGSGYHEWSNLSMDTSLAKITVTGSATLGDKGTTTLGNPTNALEVTSGATLVFYNNGAATVTLNKKLILNDGSTLQNGGGANTIVGPVTLTNSLGSIYCSLVIGGTSLTLNGPLSGNGVIYMNTGTSTLVVNSNSPSYAGGALLVQGKLAINANFGSGAVTTYGGSVVAGHGTVGGLLDVAGALLPGDAGVMGTFHAAGGLTLESSATLTNDLSSTIAGSNDLVVVTGDLTANNNIIVLNPASGTLQNGIYPLITYTGNLNNSFAGVQTVSPSAYTLTLTNITSTSPKEIGVIVSGTPSSLVWNNAAGNNEWDVLGSYNWSNLVSHASEQFANADMVLFDDSITNAAVPGTNIDIASGQVVIPSVITNNSTVNYAFSGAGKISGGAGIVKMGGGTLTISNMPNDFTGNITILGGTLKSGWGPDELGSTNGTITVTNGATLDRGWSIVKPIIVSGVGVGGNGAIVNNSGGNAIYDGGAGGLTPSLTLAGDTTVGGNTRWDLGGTAGATLNCLGGGNYNLTINEAGGTYMEWDNVTIDTNLGNIDINTVGGSLGIKGCGASLGNPTNTLTVHPGAGLTFWGETTNNSGYAKKIHVMNGAYADFRPQHSDVHYDSSLTLDDGAAVDFYNGSGTIGTVLTGPVALNGLVHLQIGDSLVTFSNVISGTGGFYLDNYNHALVLTATNTYQGITDIRNGLTLALAGNGSISQSTPISLESGATLTATNRVDQTLTLAAGQTLEGGGTVVAGSVMVASGATVQPGPAGLVGALTISSNIVFQAGSTNYFQLNKEASPSNSVLTSTSGTITYGGRLTVANLGSALVAGDQFKLFSAGTYNGAFSGITPANPNNDSGLAWNTNNLAVNGTISVESAALPAPVITHIGLSGTTLTITATNGASNGQYVLLGTTNLATPLSLWVPVLTNSFDVNGNLNLSTNIVDSNVPREFYILVQ